MTKAFILVLNVYLEPMYSGRKGGLESEEGIFFFPQLHPPAGCPNLMIHDLLGAWRGFLLGVGFAMTHPMADSLSSMTKLGRSSTGSPPQGATAKKEEPRMGRFEGKIVTGAPGEKGYTSTKHIKKRTQFTEELPRLCGTVGIWSESCLQYFEKDRLEDLKQVPKVAKLIEPVVRALTPT